MIRHAGAFLIAAVVGTWLAAGAGSQGPAGRVVELRPSTIEGCSEEFVRAANSLQPGDTLVLRAGTYSQTCRRKITGLHGTSDRPMVITAATGEVAVLTRPERPGHQYDHNNLEIEDSSHLVIRGLELKRGSAGIRFVGVNRHITLEGNEIHQTGNNAIAMNSGDTERFIIRRNHIHHTGLLARSAGSTEGEGLYVGCHDGRCVGAHHLIEGNHIHDLRGTSEGGNDGIEIKVGSYGITVRDNVIHHTDIGTRFPCIFVYGGGPAPNVVEGNALWNCGEGIQVVSDATVRNNIIAGSDVGITSGPHEKVKEVRNVTITNNTIHGHRTCLHLRWENARSMVLANNAVYCPGASALDAAGMGGPTRIVRANLIEGALRGGAIDGVGFLAGGPAGAAFRDPSGRDWWPRPASPLIGSAAPRFLPERDFNGTPRGGARTVGAYETDGRTSNPGWAIRPGFKTARSAPAGP